MKDSRFVATIELILADVPVDEAQKILVHAGPSWLRSHLSNSP
jgi:hypothetical protein